MAVPDGERLDPGDGVSEDDRCCVGVMLWDPVPVAERVDVRVADPDIVGVCDGIGDVEGVRERERVPVSDGERVVERDRDDEARGDEGRCGKAWRQV